MSECDRLLTLYETLSSPALKAQPVQLVVVTSTGKETTAEQPPLRQVTSRDVVVPPGVASETAELLLNSGLRGSRDPLCEALRAHRGGRFPQRLARLGALAPLWRRRLAPALGHPTTQPA